MMVKSLTRKTESFSQLLHYLSQEGRGEGFPVMHNLTVTHHHDLDAVARAFHGNARYARKRKNGVALYHEILSLSGKDNAQVTPDALHDLVLKYLSLRAPGAMAYGVIHTDRDHPHIHLVISANHLNSAKKLRLSKGQFANVKRQLEAYEKETYPQLVHSPVLPGPASKRQKREKTTPGIKDRETIKHSLKGKVLTALAASCTLSAFEHRLHACGIELYRHRRQPAGVVSGGKRYRFRTLGLEESFLKAVAHWERIPKRRRLIRDIVAEKARAMFRKFGFVQEMNEVLHRSERKKGTLGCHPALVVKTMWNRRDKRRMSELER